MAAQIIERVFPTAENNLTSAPKVFFLSEQHHLTYAIEGYAGIGPF